MKILEIAQMCEKYANRKYIETQSFFKKDWSVYHDICKKYISDDYEWLEYDKSECVTNDILELKYTNHYTTKSFLFPLDDTDLHHYLINKRIDIIKEFDSETQITEYDECFVLEYPYHQIEKIPFFKRKLKVSNLNEYHYHLFNFYEIFFNFHFKMFPECIKYFQNFYDNPMVLVQFDTINFYSKNGYESKMSYYMVPEKYLKPMEYLNRYGEITLNEFTRVQRLGDEFISDLIECCFFCFFIIRDSYTLEILDDLLDEW